MKIKELEKFFDYILDKIEPCYKIEVESAIKEFLKETALEVPVQEQSKKDRNSGLLILLITIESLVSKAIQIVKNDINE